MRRLNKRQESCFLKTTDNFYPNFPDNMVELSYTIIHSKRTDVYKGIRSWVSVWGNDDMGFTKTCDIDEVRKIYRKLKKKGLITIKMLLEMGFTDG